MQKIARCLAENEAPALYRGQLLRIYLDPLQKAADLAQHNLDDPRFGMRARDSHRGLIAMTRLLGNGM